MGKPRTWTDELLIDAVEVSRSMRDCLFMLELRPTGGNYKSIQRHIERLTLDTSHWRGQGWLQKGMRTNQGRPLKELLIKNSPITNNRSIKLRLIEQKLLVYICALCGNKGIWKKKPLVLRLDHINGINNDFRLSNLRFLCPNCDSQTDTYCGRNIKV